MNTRPVWLPRGQQRSKQRLTHKNESLQLEMRRSAVRLYFAVMLIVLLSLLLGCASRLPPLVVHTPPPSMPALSTPLPSVSYSETAATDIEGWRQRVMDMPTTSKP